MVLLQSGSSASTNASQANLCSSARPSRRLALQHPHQMNRVSPEPHPRQHILLHPRQPHPNASRYALTTTPGRTHSATCPRRFRPSASCRAPPVAGSQCVPLCTLGNPSQTRSAMRCRQPQAKRVSLCTPGGSGTASSVMHSRWLKPIGSSPSAALSVTSCHQSQLGAFTPSQAGGVDVLQIDQPVIVPQFAIACGHSSSAVVVLGLLVSWWCTVQEVQVF